MYDENVIITDVRPENHKDGSSQGDKLAMFPCPSFSRAGLMCVFVSMKDIENKKGLRCKSRACDIRIPLE